MKRILFMSEEEARTTLYCAGLEGKYEFYVVGNVERNQTIQFHPMCSKFINLQSQLNRNAEPAPLVSELLDIIDKESIDVLMPVSITCMKIVDEYRDKFEDKVLITPIPTKQSINELDNKYNFYLFCKKHGIPHPESMYFKSSNEINLDEITINYPLLIKPVMGAGGFDTLAWIKDKSEMAEFLAKEETDREKYFPALLQEFFEGEDIDFNGFALNGEVKASSVMKTSFHKDGHGLSFTEFVDNKSVIELGEKILSKSNYSGPTNIDMRIRKSDGKLMLIEVNPRFWDRVMTSLMDGQNYVELALELCQGNSPKMESQKNGKIWISSFASLAKAMVLNLRLDYIGYLFNLSCSQIKFINYKTKFMRNANKKLKAGA